jgi:hypothetical protein
VQAHEDHLRASTTRHGGVSLPDQFTHERYRKTHLANAIRLHPVRLLGELLGIVDPEKVSQLLPLLPLDFSNLTTRRSKRFLSSTMIWSQVNALLT